MEAYTTSQLMKMLQIGRDTAYEIMRTHGYRIGYAAKSPLRITEKQIENYIAKQRRDNNV